MKLTQTHTWNEIYAQPDIWADFARNEQETLKAIRDWVQKLGVKQVIFSGAGTSAYIGQVLCAQLPSHFRSIPTTDIVARPQDFDFDEHSLVVQFGRSGNSSETIGTLNLLDRNFPNAHRLNVTCNAESKLAKRAPQNGEQRVIVLPPQTHDQAFAMTSSFTTMYLTALAIFGTEDIQTWVESVETLAAEARNLLASLQDYDTKPAERIVVLGTGVNEGIAREMCLKIMELTAGKVATLWDSALGFRHGPKSFIDANTMILLLRHSHPQSLRYEADLLNEIQNQFPAVKILTLGENGDVHFTMQGKSNFDALLPLLFGQILAAKWSDYYQFNVDNPFADHGNLSRVVSGVTLYDFDG